MSNKKNIYWITWETQRRNRELSKAFDCEFYELDFSNYNKLIRYLRSIIITFKCLMNRPKILFVQCPSLLLCVQASFFKKIYNYILVIDAHNAILRYQDSNNIIVKFLTKYILSECNFVILTNEGFSKEIKVDQSKILILPDKLPDIHTTNIKPQIFSDSKFNVVFISSFAADEPVEEFLKAANLLKDKCKFFITGKKSKAKELLIYQSDSIVFTDFLNIEDYENLIKYADLNIDLTILEDLLVCGAYETLAVGVPGMLSDSHINHKIFYEGFLYTKTDSKSITESLEKFTLNSDKYKSEIKEFKNKFNNLWNEYFNICKKRLDEFVRVNL